jgi:hypothetical protein
VLALGKAYADKPVGNFRERFEYRAKAHVRVPRRNFIIVANHVYDVIVASLFPNRKHAANESKLVRVVRAS